MMKCFERQVKDHITSRLYSTPHPLKLHIIQKLSMTPYPQHCTWAERTITLMCGFFSALQLGPQYNHPSISKLSPWDYWILHFLTGITQLVKVGKDSSKTITLSTGIPQSCVLSPLLFILMMTFNCCGKHSSTSLRLWTTQWWWALIKNVNESSHWEEVNQLVDWWKTNILSLNVGKTKEITVDVKKNCAFNVDIDRGVNTILFCRAISTYMVWRTKSNLNFEPTGKVGVPTSAPKFTVCDHWF